MANINKIIIIVFSVITFIACGDDDSTTLIYQQSRTDTIRVYIGSESGVIRIPRDSLKRSVNNYVGSMFETYTDGRLTFEEDLLLIKQGSSMSEKRYYKFEGSSLLVLSGEEWIYIGTGSRNEMNIKQHYIATISNNVLTFMPGPSVEDLTAEEAVKVTPFGSLQNMTSKTDTLIICTRESFFQ